MSSKHVDVADLIGITTPRPCPQCRHPEVATLLDQSEPPKAVAICCRHCMWQRGGHALVREYMEHCGHDFTITCAACDKDCKGDYLDAYKDDWHRIGKAWICHDHRLELRSIVLTELLDENELTIERTEEGRLL